MKQSVPRTEVSERQNVLRWQERLEGAELDIYHPLTALGVYGQSYQREQLSRLLADHMIRLDRMEILDLGSGTGTWCRYFAEMKGTTEGIVGVELSPKEVARARGLSPIEYVEGDMTKVTMLVDRTFDFVSAFVSLMFLADVAELRRVLGGVASVLRPGGYMLISEKETSHAPERDWSGWPRTELAGHARSVGLEVVDWRGLFKVFFGRYDSYYGVSFSRMDWFRFAERILPGRWGYYFLLLQKPATPPLSPVPK
jgi:SAM-dependent methyltransferase